MTRRARVERQSSAGSAQDEDEREEERVERGERVERVAGGGRAVVDERRGAPADARRCGRWPVDRRLLERAFAPAPDLALAALERGHPYRGVAWFLGGEGCKTIADRRFR